MSPSDTALTKRWISTLLDASPSAGPKLSVLVVAADGSSMASLISQEQADVVVLVGTDAPEELGDSGLFDLALVAGDALPNSTVATRLISSLRDRYARRVVVIDDGELLCLSDYLALGFERLDNEAGDRSFIFDPDSASRQREWNNARNWANPQNFDKYRW